MTETEKLIIDKLDFLGTEIDDIKAELKSDIEGGRTELQAEIDDIQDDILGIDVILENDVSRKIDIIAERHDLQKMDPEEVGRLEIKLKKMEREIIDNHLEILKIKSHLRMA